MSNVTFVAEWMKINTKYYSPIYICNTSSLRKFMTSYFRVIICILHCFLVQLSLVFNQNMSCLLDLEYTFSLLSLNVPHTYGPCA